MPTENKPANAAPPADQIPPSKTTKVEVEKKTTVIQDLMQGTTNAEVTDDDQVVSKASWIARAKCSAQRHGKLAAACLGSLATGIFLSWFCSGRQALPNLQVVSEAKAPSYVATNLRRNEPISPLVPFEGLKPEVVELGRRLFHDPGLSGTGRQSCSSCHILREGGDDGRKFSMGVNNQPSQVNAPSVLNAALNFVQFWDGRSKTLEEQLDAHLADAVTMASDWERIVKYVNSQPNYARNFQEHLGGEGNHERVLTAIATYERWLITVNSKFDQWLQGTESALSSDALSGYYLFQKLNCISCHQGPGVGGTTFQPMGELIKQLTAARPATPADLGRFNATEQELDRYVFRVPSLRNIALSAPYFHDGSAETLEQAVSTMIRNQAAKEPNPEEVRRIVLFLETLTGELPSEAKTPDVPKRVGSKDGQAKSASTT